MKKLFTLLVAVLLTATVWAQAPQKMSYQAVIRNSGGTLVTSTQIGMEINIHQGSTSGTIVYTETQTPTTNANGLVSIEIGGGTGFDTINWATNTYYIETKTAVVAPLTTYTITGTSQLLSVPYALNAKTAESITGTITETDPVFTGSQAANITANDITKLNNLSGTNTGDQDLSGLATTSAVTTSLNLKVDKEAGKGLSTNDYTTVEQTKLAGIATGAEVNVNADWNAVTGEAQILNKPTIPTAADGSETKVTAGTNVTVTGAGTTASPYVINSTSGGSGTHYLGEEYLGGIIFNLYTTSDGTQHGLIVSETETTATWIGSSLVGADRTEDGAYNMNLMPTGAGTARTWVETLGVGWYLPSVDELGLLWHSRYYVNKTARAVASTLLSTTAYYWSSTEYSATYAFDFNFGFGSAYDNNKTSTYSVRGVRAF